MFIKCINARDIADLLKTIYKNDKIKSKRVLHNVHILKRFKMFIQRHVMTNELSLMIAPSS